MRENRNSVRIPIDLSCNLRLSSGLTVEGRTQNLSPEGAFMITQSLRQKEGQAVSELSGAGVFTLEYGGESGMQELKVTCRVAHVTAHGVGLFLFTSLLSHDEQAVIGRLLEQGSAQV